jgi:arsenate reductase
MMSERKKVLIVCTGNAARSQMAEGLLRHDAGDRFEVFSAGIYPSYVRPLAIEAMREVGIDISAHRSKSVEDFADEDMDYVITVCDHANEVCPVFPATTKRIHWSIADPVAAWGDDEAQLQAFRVARDDIRERFRKWLAEEPANA